MATIPKLKPCVIRIRLMLVVTTMLTTASANSEQRFIYKHISDTATLQKGMHELDYHFWLEDWDRQGWNIKVIRNELTYRHGLSKRTELGINQMHSSLMYWYGDYYWGTRSGFNDLQLYAKHQFLKEPDLPVTFSLGGKLFAPTGSYEGFSSEKWGAGGFLAISKNVGSWRFAGHFGRIIYDESHWQDHNYWGVGALEKKYGFNLEIFGANSSLQGLIGLTHQHSDGYVQYGLAIPMTNSNMKWRFIFGLGTYF
ncbi:hypothetical protein ACFL6U_11315 [Planctomycetota bacterium]